MNMRNIMAGLAVTTLVLGSASLALARGHNGGHHNGMMNGTAYSNSGYQNLTPEKRAAVDRLIQEHTAATAPLREQLQAKRLELDALSRNPNVKPDKLSKLSGEVAELSARLRSSGDEFRAKIAAETGVKSAPRGMMGYGRGHMDGGHMMGSGHMNGNQRGMGWHN